MIQAIQDLFPKTWHQYLLTSDKGCGYARGPKRASDSD